MELENQEILNRPQPIIIPPPVQMPQSEEYEEEPTHPKLRKDELDYLFEVPQAEDNDIYTDDLVELPEDENLDDLFSVSNDDIMGAPPRKRKIRRTMKRYPPTGMGGMRV